MTESDVDVVTPPRVETWAERRTVGIRETVPFRTMLAQRDRLLSELVAWLAVHDSESAGPFFLRLHVVDMAGLMDIEVGVVVDATTTAFPTADARVRSSVIPAGRYAVLDYRRTSLPANRMIQRWMRDQGLEADVRTLPQGDAFTARCEIYLTDPRTERRKTNWVVELAFLLR